MNSFRKLHLGFRDHACEPRTRRGLSRRKEWSPAGLECSPCRKLWRPPSSGFSWHSQTSLHTGQFSSRSGESLRPFEGQNKEKLNESLLLSSSFGWRDDKSVPTNLHRVDGCLCCCPSHGASHKPLMGLNLLSLWWQQLLILWYETQPWLQSINVS